MKKYTLNRLKGRLSSGKGVFFCIKEDKGNIVYNIDIEFWRLDIIKEIKDKYPKETYVLTIEKYNSEYPGDKEGGCLIELRQEFNSVEDIIDYLDKNKFIKKEEWIVK